MAQTLGTFYEFFSGAGMVRAGLGDNWRCLFANDFDRKKAATYRRNWGGGENCGDVRDVTTDDLPGEADLAWASFPCQDLSLAGCGAGLRGERSGTFWPFWDLVTDLDHDGRAPALIVLENVCGTLTSRGGKDFAAICRTLQDGGYHFGALIVDAVLFVPQSRPRLFLVAVRDDIVIPEPLNGHGPSDLFHPRMLRIAYHKLPKKLQEVWIWWDIEAPPARNVGFTDLIENRPTSVVWHTAEETRKLLGMMSSLNLEKVRNAQRQPRRIVGSVYKRTRCDDTGRKVQRAEVRFDDIAGCLRTPVGGSSRQTIILVEGPTVRSRLISTRETARLMGLPDDYVLPENYNEAYHLTGDGVVVSVVSFLAREIFEPVLAQHHWLSLSPVPSPNRSHSMSVIPCEQNKTLRKQIEDFAETLKTQSHTLGTHGLEEKDFYNSGLFRGAIERIRGQYSATMRQKREFVRHVLNYMQDQNYVAEWDSAGEANRHDYAVQLPSDRTAIIELKGCLDGNNTNIFERPAHANEFIIWSVCTNIGADPRHNAWSGIHTRLSAEIIERAQRVDGVVIWDMVCGTIGRPCPKIARDSARRTEVGRFLLPPPCLYLLPATIPSPRNNPRPTPQDLADVQIMQALSDCFRCEPQEINYVSFEVAYRGSDTVRTTRIRRDDEIQRESDPTAIRRS